MTLKPLALAAAALIAATAMALAQSQPPSSPPAPPAASPPAESEAGVRPRGDGRRAMAACRADMQTLCGDAPRGRGARMQCLVANKAKVSAACADAMRTIEERMATGGGRPDGRAGRGRLAQCRTDIATHCSSVEPGRGGRIACLKANAAKLTPECGAAVQAVESRRVQTRQAIREACRSDAQALCQSAAGPKSGLRKCLTENQGKLSPACSQALAALPKGKRG